MQLFKRIIGLGITTLIVSNKRMNDIMKMIKCLKDAGLFKKGASETVANEAKKQKVGLDFSACYYVH